MKAFLFFLIVSNHAMAQTRTVVVQKGETLRTIAQKNLGDKKDWIHIFKLNQNKIKNPQVVAIGTELVLPDNISAITAKVPMVTKATKATKPLLPPKSTASTAVAATVTHYDEMELPQ